MYAWAVTTKFSSSGELEFDGFRKNMLQTKAALVASLNLMIIYWSLSKNRA